MPGAFAGAGARVAINDRTRETCEAAAAGIEGAVAAPFDVTGEAAPKRFAACLRGDDVPTYQRRRCVFSILVLVLIVIVVLALLGFFGFRGRA
jgi:NAD(P)-dependent dehydrogenase (short-subunit alcohol dehydrogenase family)